MSVINPPPHIGRANSLVPEISQRTDSVRSGDVSHASSRASYDSISPAGTQAASLASSARPRPRAPAPNAALSDDRSLNLSGPSPAALHASRSATESSSPKSPPFPASPVPVVPDAGAQHDHDSGSDESSIGTGRCLPAPDNRPSIVPEPSSGMGGVVAQLSWKESVRNVCAHAFRFGPSRPRRSHQPDFSSQPQDESHVSHRPRLQVPAHSYVVLVVVLRTRAVVLEMGPFADSQNPQPQGWYPESGTSGQEHFMPLPPWQITERLVVPVCEASQGLGAIRPIRGHPGTAMIVLTGRQAGHVQSIQLAVGPERSVRVRQDSASPGPSAIIAAHESALSVLTLSPCGSLLATMSDKGTLVRLWSTFQPGQDHKHGRHTRSSSSRVKIGFRKVRELRRGLDTAKIHDVSFSPDSRWLAVVSETGTIHLFFLSDLASSVTGKHSGSGGGNHSLASTSGGAMGAGKGSPARTETKPVSHSSSKPSKLGSLSRVVPSSMIPRYFSSEWSTAIFRLRLTNFAPHPSTRREKSGSAAAGGETSSTHRMETDAVRMQTGFGEVAPPPPADWVQVASSKGKDFTAAGPTREGQWASLRQRISSARKGEAAIDERVSLGWIATEAVSQPLPSIATTAGSSLSGSHPRSRSSGRSRTASPTEPFQLLAATTAGHLYRIALDSPWVCASTDKMPRTRTGSTPTSGGDTFPGEASEGEDAEDAEDLVLSMYRRGGASSGRAPAAAAAAAAAAGAAAPAATSAGPSSRRLLSELRPRGSGEEGSTRHHPASSSSSCSATGAGTAAGVSAEGDDEALSGSKGCRLEEYRLFGHKDVFAPSWLY